MRSRSAKSRLTLAAVLVLSPSAGLVAWLSPADQAVAADAEEDFRAGVKNFEEGLRRGGPTRARTFLWSWQALCEPLPCPS